MNNNIKTVGCRDIAYGTEEQSQLRQIIESIPFHCRVLVSPQQRIGIIRIEYEGDSEEGVKQCDLKLTAKLITYSEEKGSRNLVLFPLEFY